MNQRLPSQTRIGQSLYQGSLLLPPFWRWNEQASFSFVKHYQLLSGVWISEKHKSATSFMSQYSLLNINTKPIVDQTTRQNNRYLQCIARQIWVFFFVSVVNTAKPYRFWRTNDSPWAKLTQRRSVVIARPVHEKNKSSEATAAILSEVDSSVSLLLALARLLNQFRSLRL